MEIEMGNALIILAAAARETESLVMQYVIVAVIIIAALVWIGVKIFSKKNKGKGGCCGCSLAEHCSPQKRKEHGALHTGVRPVAPADTARPQCHRK